MLASRGGSFYNDADADAVVASGSGRYLIYSDTPDNTFPGGLTGAGLYNRTFDANAPSSITSTGDRFIYSLAPTLTYTAADKSRTYGAANPSFTFTTSGLLTGDTLGDVVTGSPSLSSTVTSATGVGSYAIGLALGTLSATDIGYQLATANGTLTIERAVLDIAANSTSKTYSAANPSFTASYTGLVNGDASSVVSSLSLNTTATAATGVGGYAITPSGASAANYTISYTTGTLTINPAPLTITADNQSKTYGAANPGLTASYAGLVNSDASTVVSGLSLTTTATSASSVGGYAIAASGASAANYSISYAPGTLTVNAAPLTVTANNASRLFGEANPTFTAIFDGLVLGQNSSVVTGLQLTTPAVVDSVVGDYAITPSGASAANYSITYVAGTLSVANAILTITANDFARTYGLANPAFTVSYSGFIGGDDASVVSGLQFSTSAMVNSGVGTYAITPFGATAPNYGINFASGTLTINAADLTIRADSLSRTYGGANPAFTSTFTGLAGDDVAGDYTVNYSTAANTASAVGGYTVTPSGVVDANYNITFQTGTLTVDPASLNITADNQAKAYGGANPALTASYTGFVNGEDSSIVSGLSLSTTAVAGSGVGGYPISASGASAANYAISYTPGTLTVNPAVLTITADAASKTYGTVNPAFTASYNGLVNGDASSVVGGLVLNSTATTSSGVGGYPITASGGSAANYTINHVNGTLMVNAASLTITADAASKIYGAANPAFTASYSGLVNGDLSSVVSGLLLGTTAAAGSGVGGYPITASGASAGNYSISYTPGTLTVNQAPLTIRADDKSKIYGSANPTLTATYTGLVNSDAESVVSGLNLATTATANSEVASYAITATGGSAANYVINHQNGTLSVNQATLTVRAGNASRFYGDANPTFTGSITGFVLGEDAGVLTASPTYSTAAGLTTGVGGYAITPSGGSAANYTLAHQNGTLTINPAILAVRADNLVRFYGDSNPTLTTTVSGLKNGDSASGKFFISAFGTTATVTTPVGNQTIILQGLDVPNDNYSTFFANGTLTIQARPLTIRTDNVSREYGLPNPTFTATFTGLASHDTAAVIPNLGFTTVATAASPVQTLGVTPTSGINPNYSISYQAGQLSITPAPLIVAAGRLFRDYGDPNPGFTPFIASGELRAGDTAASVNLRIETTATQSSDVGAYDLTAAITSPNYTINTTPAGSLQILPAILDVTLGNLSRTYGDSSPANVTISATGLKLGQSAASVLSVINPVPANQPAGTYTHIVESPTANYQIRSVTGGQVQVNPRQVTVSVADYERIFGDANPDFVATVGGMGLASFDSPDALIGGVNTRAPSFSFSPPGLYLIDPSLIANPNYQVTSVDTGLLTVNQRPLELTVNNLVKTYADPNPQITFSIGGAGLASFHQAEDIFAFDATLPVESADVGHYPLLPRFPSSTFLNYAITLTPGYLTILPRPVQITVDSFDLAQGVAIPPFTAQFTGLPAGVSGGTAFPDLAFSTGIQKQNPMIKPVPVAASFPPPSAASIVISGANVVSGRISGGPEITTIQTVTESFQNSTTTFTLSIPKTEGGEDVNTQFIGVDGYNTSLNYAVTHVETGEITTRTAHVETELERAQRAAQERDETPLVIVSASEQAKLSKPFRGPEAQPFLQEAAETLMQNLLELGDTETFDEYFKDGVAGFLAGLQDDPARQSMLIRGLSDVVMKYALLPADQQPPALAGMISAATLSAKQVKLEQAKEVSRLYEEWKNPPESETTKLLNPYDLNLVPDFAKEVQINYAKDAAVVLGASLGAGATVGALMCAMPVGAVTAAAMSGGALTAIPGITASTSIGALLTTSTTTGAGAAAGVGMAVAAPVLVAVGAAAVMTVAAIQLSRQPDIVDAIETAQGIAAMNDPTRISLDLTNERDQMAFGQGFLNLMLAGGAW